jgi:hypothetical protein
VVLIFQEDALLCGPSLEPTLATSDYAGAPWDPTDGWVAGKAWLAAVGGNGGLSYRKRSHALACLDTAAWQKGQWEDAYFVERLQQLGRTVACSDAARGFAIERALHAPCGGELVIGGGGAVGGESARGSHHAPAGGDAAVHSASGEGVVQQPPCGLHKAYNYLPPVYLEQILTCVEEAYTACWQEGASA